MLVFNLLVELTVLKDIVEELISYGHGSEFGGRELCERREADALYCKICGMETECSNKREDDWNYGGDVGK